MDPRPALVVTEGNPIVNETVSGRTMMLVDHMKRTFSLLLAAALALLGLHPACAAAEPGSVALHDPAGRARIVAVVNRQVFTAGDLDFYAFDYRLRRPQAFDVPIEELRRRLVSTAADDLLLGSWAELQVEQPLPEQLVEASYRNSWQHYEELAGGIEPLKGLIAESELDEQALRAWVKSRAKSNQYIREAIVRRADLGGKTPYDGKVADAVRIKVAHILIRIDKSESESLEKALRVRRDIEAGVPFPKAARLYSEDDATNSRGGELGWFDAGELHEDLWAAAKSISLGATSAPVRTSAGYHLVRVIDYETPEQLEYLRIVQAEEEKQIRKLRDESDYLLADGYTMAPVSKKESGPEANYREDPAPEVEAPAPTP